MQHGKYRFIVGFLALPVLVYAVFVISPFVQAFQISLTDWSGLVGTAKFVGFENFEKLWNNADFWNALRHNVYMLIFVPIITLGLGLFFAFMLNVGGKRRKNEVITGVAGSKFYRFVFFFPQVLAIVIIGVIFQRVYAPDDSGLLNGFLKIFGIDPVLFMANGKIALWAIVAVLVWQSVGFYVVLFSAGMASIPKDIYEAATLDGADRGAMFFRVTMPLLWDTLQVAWVYLGIAAFDAFAIVQVLSVDQGGPDGATTVLGMEIYRNAFSYSQFGYASAMGVALFFLTITFAALTLRVSRRETIEL